VLLRYQLTCDHSLAAGLGHVWGPPRAAPCGRPVVLGVPHTEGRPGGWSQVVGETDEITKVVLPANKEKGIFPLKLRDEAISAGATPPSLHGCAVYAVLYCVTSQCRGGRRPALARAPARLSRLARGYPCWAAFLVCSGWACCGMHIHMAQAGSQQPGMLHRILVERAMLCFFSEAFVECSHVPPALQELEARSSITCGACEYLSACSTLAGAPGFHPSNLGEAFAECKRSGMAAGVSFLRKNDLLPADDSDDDVNYAEAAGVEW
jgi:hypothetical protein